MKKLLLPCLLLIATTAFGQTPEKSIREENVRRIISTLSSDRMMGRPAANPALLEPAIAFIESEFKKTGLAMLPGLASYRQEFEKYQVSPDRIELLVNGKAIDPANFVVVSDKPALKVTTGMAIRTIPFDTTAAKNPGQYFMRRAFENLRDTSSAIIAVAPEFASNFSELHKLFAKRFTNNRKYAKVFLLSNESVASYSLTATQKYDTVRMANVVGVIEGRSRKDEMVIFSAHYDHIGVQAAVNGDSIANGADDDASGTTAVIALADYFRKLNNNERTLVFAAFTAEEIGGYGSRYFSQQLDPDRVVAMFNIEMIGKPSKWGVNHAFLTGFERSDFGAILQKNLAGTVFEFHPDPYPQENLFYRSDNATLARLGVPAHSISTDQIDVDKFYHTVDDEVETLDMLNLTQTIRAIGLSAKSIINGTDTPSRIDKATVR